LTNAVGCFGRFDTHYQTALGSINNAFCVHTVEFVFRQVVHYSGPISVAEYVDGSPEAIPKENINDSFEKLATLKY
jgi:hypothetical protein